MEGWKTPHRQVKRVQKLFLDQRRPKPPPPVPEPPCCVATQSSVIKLQLHFHSPDVAVRHSSCPPAAHNPYGQAQVGANPTRSAAAVVHVQVHGCNDAHGSNSTSHQAAHCIKTALPKQAHNRDLRYTKGKKNQIKQQSEHLQRQSPVGSKSNLGQAQTATGRRVLKDSGSTDQRDGRHDGTADAQFARAIRQARTSAREGLDKADSELQITIWWRR